MLKKLSFLHPALYVAEGPQRGRGVFTSQPLEAATIIEKAPVIVMPKEARPLLDQTLLHDYIFEWGKDALECAVALGYISLYNHSYNANCEYHMQFKKALMTVRTVRPVAAGEELFINYNGDFDNAKTVWFDVK